MLERTLIPGGAMSRRAGERSAASSTSAPPAAAVVPASPTAGSLAGLTALGVLAALWALFLWGELALSRVGGTPFCAFGGAADCGAIWNSAFASTIHRLSGLPVAGWGLVFGLVASGLPLLALARQAQGRPDASLVSAIRMTAAAGALTVVVMMGVSAAERAFCLGCFVTYVLVGGYAGIALPGWRGAGLPESMRGASLAAGATALAFALLLYPGLRTPRAAGEAGRDAIARASAASGTVLGTGDAARDQQIQELVSSLSPELRQTLADSLGIYRREPERTPIPARALEGPADAPVRITEFTDVRCDHCADLYETLGKLRGSLPPGSFSVDPRHFPLDAECNALIQGPGRDPVRCLAARARICLEGHAQAADFAAALFAEQKALTADRVLVLAAPHVPRKELEACLASEATAAKLRADIELASRYDPDGTPIVLVNGRRGTSFGPFLYALVLTRGSADHPAFASLPPANAQAHLH